MTAKRKSDYGQQFRDRVDGAAGKKVPYRGESVFVNYTLEASDKQRLKAQIWSEVDYESCTLRLIEEGYGITLGADEYSGGFMCVLRPKYADNRNAGYLLSGRGSTPLKALKQCAFIHGVVFEGDWAAHYTSRRSPDIDD